MEKDFYWEFIQKTDEIVEKFISCTIRINPGILIIGKASMKKALANYLWEILFFSHRREEYNDQRSSGNEGDLFFEKLWDDGLSNLLPSDQSLAVEKLNSAFEKSKYFSTLIEHKECVIFFCKNHRQLLYFKPILQNIAEKTVVLAKYEVPDEFELNGNIQVIEFNSFTDEVYINNDYLKKFFPVIFEMANTYTLLLNLLKPKAFIFLEGCHFETEVISGICNSDLVPTICLQQGWPSLMHTRFKNMTYNYFLTWGENFNSLWKKYNTIPDFKNIGYLYKVKDGGRKNGITFFLQAPIFILNENYLRMQIKFAIYCAVSFTNKDIYIREHPEYKLSEIEKKELCQYSSIKIATDMPLPELFSLTEIGVSVFSSTLMEGIIHETIPFIFNPTSYPRYYPDLDKKHLGIEVKSLSEAKFRMNQLINNPVTKELISKNIRKEKTMYFTATENVAIENAVNFISSVSKKSERQQ